MSKDGDLKKGPQGQVAILRGGEWHVIAQNQQELGMLKAYSEGRMALPTGAALRNPKMAQVMGSLSLYDPSFDLADSKKRVSTANAFSTGKAAENIKALRTAIGHLYNLNRSVDGLHNFDGPLTLLNTVKRMIANATGDNTYTNFDAQAPGVAGEVNKVFVGGPGDAHGRAEFRAPFDSARSPSQLHGANSKLAGMLNERAEALRDQYREGMGRARDPLKIYAPREAAMLDELVNGRKPLPASAKPSAPAVPVHQMDKAATLKALGIG